MNTLAGGRTLVPASRAGVPTTGVAPRARSRKLPMMMIMAFACPVGRLLRVVQIIAKLWGGNSLRVWAQAQKAGKTNGRN